MKLLLDTNVFLEVLFRQAQQVVAQQVIQAAAHERYISLFSLHSIGVLLQRRGQPHRWQAFLQDLIYSGRIQVVSLPLLELGQVMNAAQSLGLDFDDAYQYVVAERFSLTLVSFDKDFDKTPRGRQTPQAILSLTNNPTPNP